VDRAPAESSVVQAAQAFHQSVFQDLVYRVPVSMADCRDVQVRRPAVELVARAARPELALLSERANQKLRRRQAERR
jgi:hypothetical protein